LFRTLRGIFDVKEIFLEDGTPNDRPPSWVDFVRRLFSGRRHILTEKDLQAAITQSEEEGIINEEEGDMLHSIFEFGDTIVREVMVPRTDMICCSTMAFLQDILGAVIASGHSRIPVYEGTNDRIVGIVYAKDLLKYWGNETLKVVDVMRTPFFVPETKNVEELLKDFRTKRVHMAIAIDEYGGTSGLITIEDLLEEIVGDIQDEYDLEETWLQQESDGSVIVDGRLNIEELEEHFEIDIPREKYDTVGGYLFDLFGHVPKIGEEVQDGPLRMKVLVGDARRIEKVHIVRILEGAGNAKLD